MTAADEHASHSMTALLRRATRTSDGTTATPSLPPDLQARAVRRLRVLALLYAGSFFLANPVSAVLSSPDEFFAGFAK